MDYGDETELSANGGDDDTEKVSAELHGVTEPKTEPSTGAVELTWSEVRELFSVLDACNFETIGFREFCAHVFLLAALQDNQLLECLYQHGVLLFDILGGGQNLITAERAKVLGRTMMGLPEKVIDEICE